MSENDESTKLEVKSSETSKLNEQKSYKFIDIIKEYFNISNQNQIEDEEKYTPEILNVPKLNYGKYITFFYINNEPLFAIGPDYNYFLILFLINIFFAIFLLWIIWENSFLFIKILGIILIIIQIFSYLITSTINPGLPKRKYQYYATHPQKNNNYRQCNFCKLWVRTNILTIHCYECNCCIEGQDHHCQWISKCVGSRNYLLFHITIISVSILFFYFFFSIFMMSFYISNKSKV